MPTVMSVSMRASDKTIKTTAGITKEQKPTLSTETGKNTHTRPNGHQRLSNRHTERDSSPLISDQKVHLFPDWLGGIQLAAQSQWPEMQHVSTVEESSSPRLCIAESLILILIKSYDHYYIYLSFYKSGIAHTAAGTRLQPSTRPLLMGTSRSKVFWGR